MEAKDFPEVDDVIIGTVDRTIGTSVFVKLDEYGNKEGVISFSEVAPGRIRNIRDYVKPGQKIACKVLRVDVEKGHMDLSLRRVSAKEKKQVMENYQKEKEIFAVMDIIVKDKKRAGEIITKLKHKTDFIELCSNVEANAESCLSLLSESGFGKDEMQRFIDIIKEKVRVKKAVARAKFSLSSESGDGIEKIKKLLAELENKGLDISYLSSPHYMMTAEDKDYKEANRRLRTALDMLNARAKGYECKFEVEKEK